MQSTCACPRGIASIQSSASCSSGAELVTFAAQHSWAKCVRRQRIGQRPLDCLGETLRGTQNHRVSSVSENDVLFLYYFHDNMTL